MSKECKGNEMVGIPLCQHYCSILFALLWVCFCNFCCQAPCSALFPDRFCFQIDSMASDIFLLITLFLTINTLKLIQKPLFWGDKLRASKSVCPAQKFPCTKSEPSLELKSNLLAELFLLHRGKMFNCLQWPDPQHK